MNTARMFHIADKTVRVGARLVHLFNPSRLASAAVDGGYIVKRHWRLALAMAHREMSTRYAGQIMGSFWVVGHPLLQMLIFVFLFGTVFQQRMGERLSYRATTRSIFLRALSRGLRFCQPSQTAATRSWRILYSSSSSILNWRHCPSKMC